jgi:ribosomal 50S subunit-recycling heat shock protein
MRIDVFLKKVLLFKNRSDAKRMCDDHLIKINGKEVKPSKQIAPGDTIEIESITGIQIYRVITIPTGNVRKNAGGEYYEEIP